MNCLTCKTASNLCTVYWLDTVLRVFTHHQCPFTEYQLFIAHWVFWRYLAGVQSSMFGCCLLGQITILYMLLGVDCKALSIRRNPCWMVSLIQSSTQYSIPLVTPSNTYMLLLEALVLSCVFWMQAAIFIFGFHANFLALFLTHSSGDVAIVILIIIIITWAACTHLGMLKHLNFCDHYVANANIATSLSFNHCFNCYHTILTKQRRQREQVAKSQLLKFLSHSLYVVKFVWGTILLRHGIL